MADIENKGQAQTTVAAPQASPAMAQTKEKKKWAPWLIGCGILVVIGLIVLCIAGILVAIMIPSFMTLTNSAEKALAETALRNVVAAGEIYRTDNDGSYLGMTAEKLIAIDDSLRVVDETPSATEVGLSDITADSYSLVYMGESGKTYKATVTDGSAKYDFLDSNSDLPLP